jgi:probable O-glycosylation ligase (exosortase A-associated)
LRDIALITVFVCVLPFVLRRPWVGILILAWLGYMNPQRLCYGFAFNSFPFTKIAAIMTMGSALMSRHRTRIPWTPETVLLIMFSAWMSFTTIFASNVLALDMWQRVISIQVSIILTLMLISERTQLRWLVWVITVSLGFYGLKGGVHTILTGGGGHVLGPPNSFIEDNNALALALAMVIPLLRFLQVTSIQRWTKWAFGFGMGLTAAAILGTYSRGGLLALAAVAFLLLLKARRRLLFAVFVGVVVFGTLKIMPDEWFARMGTIKSYEEDESVKGRFDAWRFALALANARPITGGGFLAFDRASRDLRNKYAEDGTVARDAHSIYFKVLGEHGYFGLVLFLSIGVCAFVSANWIRRVTRGNSQLVWAQELAAMSQVSILAYAVGGAFLGMAYFDLPYHIVAIVVLTKLLVRQKLREQQCDAEEAVAASELLTPNLAAVSGLV